METDGTERPIENIVMLPCPFCGSSNVADDYDAVTTTYTGPEENPTGWHEYQHGWVDCKGCGAQGPCIIAKDEQIDDITAMVRDAWNKAARQHNASITGAY